MACNSGDIGDGKHMIFHSSLFTARTDTMRSFFAQQGHLGVLNYVIDCLNFMNI